MAKAKAANSGASKAAAVASAKRTAAVPEATATARSEIAAISEITDPRKMMRDAAWRQMFGKAQSKSPFGR